MTTRASLTLGPVLYHWDPDRWSNFYARIADEAPVDRVCVGEVVCSKRTPFYADRIEAAVERLKRGGKQVIRSSLALVTLPRERKRCAALAEAMDAPVEVNDLTLLAYLPEGRGFMAGPFLNLYNEATLETLLRLGATHLCLPPELPLDAVEALARAARSFDVDTEVWAFGRTPLAISGRCYHARLAGTAKDSCRFVCSEDLDGLAVRTLDGQDFLAINGVQTLSHAWCGLLGDLPRLREAGVGAFRLSPQSCDMVAVAQLYRDVLDARLSPVEAQAALERLAPEARFANGFLSGRCGAEWTPPSATAH